MDIREYDVPYHVRFSIDTGAQPQRPAPHPQHAHAHARPPPHFPPLQRLISLPPLPAAPTARPPARRHPLCSLVHCDDQALRRHP